MRKIIIDTDGGIDDAMALIVALKEKTLDILGITTVFSNTSMVQATDNVLRILKLLNRDEDIPVYMGSSVTIDGEEKRYASDVHGENGLGEVVLPASNVKPQKDSASNFIVDMARKYPGEVSLITLGPLTNIAKALELEPELPNLLDSIHMMGGSVFASGNVTACSEANIHADAKSAKIVFSSDFNLYMIGLDVTTKVRLQKSKFLSLADRQDDETRPIFEFISKALEFYYDFYIKQELRFNVCPVHDPLAVLSFIDPALCMYKKMPVTVIVSDDITNGLTLADRRSRPSENHLISVALEVDEDRAVGKLLTYFSAN